MKLIFTSFILSLLIITVSHGQEKSLTEADYQQAVAMLNSNVSKLIDDAIRPQWTADGRVWYKSQTEDETVYKLVDPTQGMILTADSIKDLFKKAKIEQETRRESRRSAQSPDGVCCKDLSLRGID